MDPTFETQMIGVLTSMHEAVEEMEEWLYVYRTRVPEREDRWARVMAHPQTAEDGATYLHGMVLDITEQQVDAIVTCTGATEPVRRAGLPSMLVLAA